MRARKKEHLDIYPRYAACKREHNETNDCTVTSLAFLLGVSYGEAHKAMERGGRERRKGRFMHKAAAFAGMEIVKGLDDMGVTLGEFCAAHGRGKYWVEVTNHALAVVNGQVCDHSHKPRRIVQRAWRVTPTLRLAHDPA